EHTFVFAIAPAGIGVVDVTPEIDPAPVARLWLRSHAAGIAIADRAVVDARDDDAAGDQLTQLVTRHLPVGADQGRRPEHLDRRIAAVDTRRGAADPDPRLPHLDDHAGIDHQSHALRDIQ